MIRERQIREDCIVEPAGSVTLRVIAGGWALLVTPERSWSIRHPYTGERLAVRATEEGAIATAARLCRAGRGAPLHRVQVGDGLR